MFVFVLTTVVVAGETQDEASAFPPNDTVEMIALCRKKSLEIKSTALLLFTHRLHSELFGWWGRGRIYNWNCVGVENVNCLRLSSIAMLSCGKDKKWKNTFSYWNFTTSLKYWSQRRCEMMSYSNTSCFFLSLFGPREQLFLCFTRGDQIVIQEIRLSTIGATALTLVSSPSRSGSGLSEHKESPFLTGASWSIMSCVLFTKQQHSVCILMN